MMMKLRNGRRVVPKTDATVLDDVTVERWRSGYSYSCGSGGSALRSCRCCCPPMRLQQTGDTCDCCCRVRYSCRTYPATVHSDDDDGVDCRCHGAGTAGCATGCRPLYVGRCRMLLLLHLVAAALMRLGMMVVVVLPPPMHNDSDGSNHTEHSVQMASSAQWPNGIR